MVAKAHAKYLRISPRKVKIVLDLIRGKDVGTATAILLQTPKAGSEPVLKLLKSADVTMVDISFTNEGGVVLLPY